MLFLVLLPLLFLAASAEDVTVVLQNGLEGYTGCEDAYVADWMSQNTGNDDTLYAEFEQCDG
jgi:hypothetical protein